MNEAAEMIADTAYQTAEDTCQRQRRNSGKVYGCDYTEALDITGRERQ
jgi:hypothetical protein